LDTSVSNDYLTGVTVRIIDGAAIVNIRKPRLAKTFGEYVDNNLIPFFRSQLADVERLDIVWDQYFSNSLKQQVRMTRGEGSRKRVLKNTTIPKNWSSFLRNSDNKRELFCYISEQLEKIDIGHKAIYTTYLDRVLFTGSANTESTSEIEPCDHEESDTRMFIHAAHAARHGHTKVVLQTVDTDVLVLAVAQTSHLGLAELWSEFGVGKHYRVISASNIASVLGYEKSSALPFFHALTGCDTTSAFSGRGKKRHGIFGTYFLKLHLPF